MTTVVQSQYRTGIRPGVAGMIADESGWEVGTRQCETAAGIGFGLAVSQGTNDKGCVLGGSAFIGVSVRDITQDGAPLDPLADARSAVDLYPQYSNVAFLSRGHIWVEAQASVKGGDPLSYDTTSGKFSTGTSGAAARGYIDFSQLPAADQNIVLNGKTITFKASGATGLQSNIGLTIADTVANLAAMLNASADTTVDDSTYLADGNRLWMSYDTVGTGGNAITITAGTTTGATASGATLEGGTAASTAVSGGYWLTSAIAGQLAKISLGIQR